jgi:hypothetical protein
MKDVPVIQTKTKIYLMISGGGSPFLPRAVPNHTIKVPKPNPKIQKGGKTNFIQNVYAEDIVL